MKILIIFLSALNLEVVAIVKSELKPFEFCSDKAEEYVTYIENKGFENTGQPWVYGYVNNKKVGGHYCLTIDKKYLVSYYDPEYEKGKK
mgnify:FL=1|tara:strand:+ start:376 stop:642 length:267 start_codon:yes stop_codon:yes gene_type:complete